MEVLGAFGLPHESPEIVHFGTGLINKTWKVTSNREEFILQKINHRVFPEPGAIARNITRIAGYLRKFYPEYKFAAPVPTLSGEDILFDGDSGYYRVFPFITGSRTCTVAQTSEMAYEAAAQFGKFTRMLSGMEAGSLEITIPDFHNLGKRYQQFLDSIHQTDAKRKTEASEWIMELFASQNIVEEYNYIIRNPEFKTRVTHHDTKISNVLFDANQKGICVIDLDTVMPGYFISDIGDMMRTYLCPVTEEESDLSKIRVRKEFYQAIVHGYRSEMKEELTETEKKYFFYAGKFSIYMQALRFLTDFLNGDIYYGSAYPGQNLMRAANQVILLKKLVVLEPELNI